LYFLGAPEDLSAWCADPAGAMLRVKIATENTDGS